MTSGSNAEAEIRLALGRDPDMRLWRNFTAEGWVGRVIQRGADRVVIQHPRHVAFGLAPGSADLIGIRRVTITPDMVGTTIGVFVSIEVKSGTGQARVDQVRWARMIKEYGGRAGVVFTPAQAERIAKGETRT